MRIDLEKNNNVVDGMMSLRNDRRFRCVVLLSTCVVFVCLALNLINPPFDGDSYEYAGVAANLVQDGELRLDHVRVYHVPGQTIPQPAWNRATLWTFILAPFHAVFGRSFLTFFIPYLITLFLFSPAVYIFARNWFTEEVAFCASVASLLNPRVLHWSFTEDPGQPELLLVIVTLAALGFFIRKKGALSGFAAGVALLTRMTGLLFLPLFLLWQLLFRRGDLFKKYLFLFIAVFAIVSAPLFIRNKIVFGDFMYSDQSVSVLSGGEQLVQLVEHPSVFDIAFKYRFAHELNNIRRGFTPEQFARFIKENTRTYLFGHHNGMAWYPGLIGMLSLLIFPFAIYGAFLCFRHPERSLIVFYPVSFMVLIIAMRPGYEDRYIFPVVPFFIMLAFHGISAVAKKFAFISPIIMLAVFLFLEVIPSGLILTAITLSDSKEPRYTELKAVCEWVKSETDENAVMMTIPFWSPQYICERATVPPVKGNLGIFKTVADEFGVDYLMFSEYWGGDRFPGYSFMEPVLRGKYITLYKIDRNADSYINMATEYGYMADFDFLNYFWEKPLAVRIDMTPEYDLSVLLKSGAAGILAYYLLCALLLCTFLIKRKLVRNILYTIFVFALIVLEVDSLKIAGDQHNMIPPPYSLIQKQNLSTQLNKEYGVVDFDFSADGPAVFIPVEGNGIFISSKDAANLSNKNTVKEDEEYQDAVTKLKDRGMETRVIAGGVIGFSTGHVK